MPITPESVSYAAPAFVSVGTSTTVILAANDLRLCVIIVNDAADDVYIGIGAAAVVGSGIRLNSGGGSLQIGGPGGIALTLQAINGISNTAAQNVTVQEGILI